MATENNEGKANSTSAEAEKSGPAETRESGVPPELAWQFIRELVFTVSQHVWEDRYPTETTARDSRRYERRTRLLRDVIAAISKFNAWDEDKFEAAIVAKHAQPALCEIYKRIVEENLPVSESRPLILSRIKRFLVPLSKDGACPFDDEMIAKHLVKTREEISIGTKVGTSVDGGVAITGPALVADKALGELLGIGFRAVHDRRKGADLDHLTYRFRYGTGTMALPGFNDKPYAQIVETLCNVFRVAPDEAVGFARELGAEEVAVSVLDEEKVEGGIVSIPLRWVLTHEPEKSVSDD